MSSAPLPILDDVIYSAPSRADRVFRPVPYPEKLTVSVVGDGKAYTLGSAGGGEVNGLVAWKEDTADTAGVIEALQVAAEDFRAGWEQYLNAVDAADLTERLRRFTPVLDWTALTYEGDREHQKAWGVVSTSSELRNLAYYGNYLYNLFFPRGDHQVRGYLDKLLPGSRLDINWQVGMRLGPVPWALMYRDPLPPDGEPIQPENFLGLRYRIAYTAYNPRGALRYLGDPGKTHQGFCLFWGNQEDEPAVAEAQRQHRLWSSCERRVIVPRGPNTPNPKAELKLLLRSPQPRPMGVLYFYCHCSKDEQRRLILRFGDTNDPQDILAPTDLDTDPLPDRPLVFVNGCATAVDNNPLMANDLVTKFFLRECRAYIGTVAKVPVELACRFATAFFELFGPTTGATPLSAGEALAQARLFLWNHYRNLGGLYYACINKYDLYLAPGSSPDEGG